jgi:hypothetical protein
VRQRVQNHVDADGVAVRREVIEVVAVLALALERIAEMNTIMRPFGSKIARACGVALSGPRSEVCPLPSQTPIDGICGKCFTSYSM